MQILKHSATFLIAFLSLLALFPADMAYAASTHTITLLKADETKLSTVKISNGMSIGNLPDVNNLLVWVDELGNVITSETIPASDMIVKAVTKEDVLSHGTLDNGNIIWFILDGHLYVTGTGKIGTIPEYKSTGSTKKYGFSIGDIQVEQPAVMYDWLYKPSVGDEQTTGYGAFKIPDNPVRTVSLNISRPLSITGQTIGYPHSTMSDYIPWKASAKDITSITFAETVKLSGNFTLYFNANSASVIPSELKESIYSNLEYIYMFADTSDVVQMAGMYARIPHLKGIYTLSGNSYHTENCWDMAGMFYGNENFTCDEKNIGNHKLISIINVFSNVSNVEDMRYMLFACKSLKQPSIGNWNTSSLKDTSYMAAGCTNLQLTLAGTAKPYDLGNWDMTNVYSTTGMFAGSNIDLTSSNPVSNLWGTTNASVISGEINLDLWDLSSLQVSVFMFAQNHTITDVIWTAELPLLRDTSAMFAFCEGLNSVYFVNLDSPLLSYIDVMFFSAGSSDGTADLSGMNLSVLRESRYAFYGTGFKKINLDKTNPEELLNAEGMFAQNKNLTSLGMDALSGWNLPKLKDASFMFYNCCKLPVLKSNNWNMGKIKSVSYMFALCSSLNETGIGLWKIGNTLKNMDCFLYRASGIKNMDLSLWNASQVETAFMSFSRMSALVSADVSGIKFDLISNANGMFAYDAALKKVITCEQPGTMLSDASGMFFGCTSLTSAEINNLISATAKNISYICSGVSSMQTLDISGWDTSGAEYMQCAFDNMSSLESLEIGEKFSTASAKTTAAMFRNCSMLSDVSLQKLILAWNPVVTESISAMFKNTAKLTTLNLSGKNFSKVSNYANAFAGNKLLTNVTIPADFFSGVKNSSSGIKHTFFVEDDTLTYLTLDISSTSIPNKLAAYDWLSDNRTFMLEKDAYITEKEDDSTPISETAYTFSETGTDKINLHYDVVSTFFTGDTPVPILFSWKNGDNSISNASESKYSVSRGNIGTYTATASLQALKNADTLSQPFQISQTSGISKLSAEYTGKPVVINGKYSFDDLSVFIYFADGTKQPVKKEDIKTDQETILTVGDNTFHVYYTDIDNHTWSASFTVTGYRPFVSIEAEYIGKPVMTGNNFKEKEVVVTAYYIDDSAKTQGIKITPTSFNSLTVTEVGNNTFTVYYKNESTDNIELSDTFTVSGYVEKVIDSVTASYNGDKIAAGSCYDKSNVTVTLNYNDNTTEKATVFTVDSLLVKNTGVNIFTATYTDIKGNVYHADFNVEGIALPISYIKAAYKGKDIAIGNSYSKEDVAVTVYYSDGTSKETDTFSVNNTKVTAEGRNTFTASIADSKGKSFTADFTVNGYSLSKIASIEAAYNGPDIPVGQTYNTNDVIVTITFTDGKTAITITDFTVDASTVTNPGNNTFTAFVLDAYGNKFSDSFIVNGIGNTDSGNSTNNPGSNLGVQTGESNDLLGVCLCLAGFILLFIVLLYFIIKDRKKGQQK